jgi:hypothetical protein
MRRFILLGALGALLAAAIAASASAQTVTRFSVIEVVTSGHPAGKHHFVTTGKLVEPGDRDDVVGRDEVRFSRGGHVNAVAFFPDGKLKAIGNLAGHKLPIVGGTRRWDGAGGKIKFQPLSSKRTRLTFTVVQ